MTAAHLDPARKHDFVFLIEAVDSNPNGDPDNGGIPRTDPITGQGLITDVAIKRKIRNTVAVINSVENKAGFEIYVEAGTALNAQHERAYADTATDKQSAQAWMCRTFFDVRMFGAVMTTGKRDKQAGRVQGPVQIGFARSVDPVTPLDVGITRVTPTRQEDVDAWNDTNVKPDSKNKGKETEMGSKHVVPYGLYKGTGHFSAPLAQKTGVTSDDLAAFWRAFTLMFEHDRAAARAGLALRGLYVFTHDDAFGRAPSHMLFDRIAVKPRGDASARSFADYGTVEVRDTDLPPGVTLASLLPDS
ncbi:type I-C CRISPR-associated protein Cas7/Csd2 [Streptomyces sp. TRM 70351]|uniref:type I-C CRISPR-associated protein Cas7/Csd2 n=1 Tax=Streptomyces sp. TRM 70351 TaxID=3116552 RepID=UPI002E7C1AD3|nr:type I-C CRISPR-associated protein Cas7/Csd2 [Streptomyces sp. TRM 70351]MEE1928312.1 type I-C CRISPR-associated protein Cas7/Csd2 [Streptomyces sp. TRM 70351]